MEVGRSYEIPSTAETQTRKHVEHTAVLARYLAAVYLLNAVVLIGSSWPSRSCPQAGLVPAALSEAMVLHNSNLTCSHEQHAVPGCPGRDAGAYCNSCAGRRMVGGWAG